MHRELYLRSAGRQSVAEYRRDVAGCVGNVVQQGFDMGQIACLVLNLHILIVDQNGLVLESLCWLGMLPSLIGPSIEAYQTHRRLFLAGLDPGDGPTQVHVLDLSAWCRGANASHNLLHPRPWIG